MNANIAAEAGNMLQTPQPASRLDETSGGVASDNGDITGSDKAGAVADDEQSEPVTPLREDIRLHPGPQGHAGDPSYVLHDPAADAYFHIGAREFEMLSRWHLGDPEVIAQTASRETAFRVDVQEVVDFNQQLETSGLVRSSSARIIAALEKIEQNKPHTINRFVNGLLFKRIPLVRPHNFLDATAFVAAPFFMAGLWRALFIGFVIALYLISRQWDVFSASLSNMVNLHGALAIFVALVISKSLHELAHGYAARRYGSDVPVMGIAFIIFWPLLYTETSNAWTLPARRDRIIIAVAGVAVEMALAIACFIAWPLLEPGSLRDAAGFAATTLIVLSLAFNANPLMRFDGYFVLSELTGIENMQPRGFELLKWHLRKLMPGVVTPYPETALTQHQRRRLLIYGIASAFYRIILFSGIVYAINLLLFPAIALPFSGVIIMSSLIYPSLHEVAVWFRLAHSSNGVSGIIRTTAIIALLVAPLFIPWRSSVQVPITIAAGQSHDSFASEPAQVARIETAQGAIVSRGTALMRLTAPNLEFQMARSREQAATLDRLINRQLTGVDYHRDMKVSESELVRLQSEINGLVARQARLTIVAPADGVVSLLDEMLRPGVWVRDDRPLIQIVTPGAPQIFAYAEERDMGLIEVGANAQIWFEGRPGGALRGKIETIFPQALTSLDEPMMAVPADGPIAVRSTADRLVPEMALYKVKIMLDERTASKLPLLKTRGFARIETAPRNIIGRITDRLVGLWRRELG